MDQVFPAEARDLADRVGRLESVNNELNAYRVLVTSAPDAILLVSREGVIEFANPEATAMFGYTSDELKGMQVDQLVPAEVRSRHGGHRAGYDAGPRKRPMGSQLALEAMRADGSRVPVEISLSPVEADGTHQVLALVRDVTDRREAERTISELSRTLARRVRHLEALNSELESFSYSVSHDLRAPLRALDGFSLAIVEDYGDLLDEQGRDYLARIRAAAQRMAALIDDLLQLSRVSRAELNRESVSVSDMAGVIVRELQRDDPDRAATVEIDPSLRVDADPRLLRGLLDNLLGNAWKFTSKKQWTHIRVAAAELGGEPAISVVDNGAGFDPEFAGRMFAAFQRMHNDAEYPGTGIGLAIAQRIVARHGGRITASGKVDEGATFTFTLAEGAHPPEEAP